MQVGKRHEGLQKLVDALPAIRHKVSMSTHTHADYNCLINCTYGKEKWCKEYWSKKWPGKFLIIVEGVLTTCIIVTTFVLNIFVKFPSWIVNVLNFLSNGTYSGCLLCIGQCGGVYQVWPHLSFTLEHARLLDLPRLPDDPSSDRVGQLDHHEAANRSQPWTGWCVRIRRAFIKDQFWESTLNKRK